MKMIEYYMKIIHFHEKNNLPWLHFYKLPYTIFRKNENQKYELKLVFSLLKGKKQTYCLLCSKF